MRGQVFEGKTVEEALQKAAAELGVAIEELEHEPAGEKSGDFWGLGDPAVCVRAWVPGGEESVPPTPRASREEPGDGDDEATETAQPPPELPVAAEDGVDSATSVGSFFEPTPELPAERAEPGAADAAPEQEPVSGPPPTPKGELAAYPPAAGEEGVEPGAGSAAAGAEEEAADNLGGAAVALLNSIFGAMEFDCVAEARVDGDALLIAISGDDNQYLVEGRGRGLSALELILNHAFRHRAGADPKKIHVDAGDFRARHEDEIRDLAYQVSHQAKETGTEQETQPLNPYERRIVHLTLADDAQVTTRSRGTGFMKAVSIIPTRRGRR